MDFCTSCGIMLPVELAGTATKCKACDNQDKMRNSHAKCNCDLCKTSVSISPDESTSNYNKDISSSEITNTDNKREKYPRKKSKNDNSSTNSKSKSTNSSKQRRQCKQYIDVDLNIGEKRVAFPEDNPTDWAHCKDVDDTLRDWGPENGMDNYWGPVKLRYNDWGPVKSWADSVNAPDGLASCNDHNNPLTSTSYALDLEEDHDKSKRSCDWDFESEKFNVASKGSVWTEVKQKSKRRNKMFGDHEFPVLEKGLTADGVQETLRVEWERQQEEYKKKLVMSDTTDIVSLVQKGERRKGKGHRFHVGGVDISFIKDNSIDACACLSVIRLPDLKLVYQAMEMVKLTEPYIPGYLAFREVPALKELYYDLIKVAPHYKPDVIMVDGNGILHPKGFGLASQLGVILDTPTIGVAKTLMAAQGIADCKSHKLRKCQLQEAGEGFDLVSEETNQVLGKCMRVHDLAPNPMYVSVGHNISLESAVWLVLECSKYRIPEPVRRADLDSREYLRTGKREPEVFMLD